MPETNAVLSWTCPHKITMIGWGWRMPVRYCLTTISSRQLIEVRYVGPLVQQMAVTREKNPSVVRAGWTNHHDQEELPLVLVVVVPILIDGSNGPHPHAEAAVYRPLLVPTLSEPQEYHLKNVHHRQDRCLHLQFLPFVVLLLVSCHLTLFYL